jgi:Restriction endonuclease
MMQLFRGAMMAKFIPSYREIAWYDEDFKYENERDKRFKIYNGDLIYNEYHDYNLDHGNASDDLTVEMMRGNLELPQDEASVFLQHSNFFSKPECIYCKSAMVTNPDFALSRKITDESNPGDAISLQEELFECPICGWWAFFSDGCNCFKRDRYKYNHIWTQVRYGRLQKYDVSSVDAPLSGIRDWLSIHPEDMALLNPFAFERLVASCFREHYSDVEVIHIGGIKDRGIDIVLVKNEKICTIIQVKRRQNIQISESVSTVRELNGVLLREGVSHGIVVTTAKDFSAEAKKESQSKENSLARYRVELRSFDNLAEILSLTTKKIRSEEYASGILRNLNRARDQFM